MKAADILAELQSLGRESYKRVLVNNHGVKEPCFGVAISELQKIRKRIKKDYQLALDLYDTSNYDAMYLAGLIADDVRMTKKDLQHWVASADGGALAGSTVAGTAAGSPHGWDIALKWIDSPKDHIACAGWATLAAIATVRSDPELDLPALKQLLQRVQKSIHGANDRVRYQMNGFLIAVGCTVAPLTALALQIGEKLGPIEADLGNNSCQIPFAPDSIRKVEARGTIGKKRKSARC